MISYNFVYRNMLVRRTGNICKIYDGHKLLVDLCYRNDEFIKIWIDGYMEGRKNDKGGRQLFKNKLWNITRYIF